MGTGRPRICSRAGWGQGTIT